jgi:twitching motility protein PilT
MEQKKLNALPFVDLYICLAGDAAPHYRAQTKGLKKHPEIAIPQEFSQDMLRLTEYIKANLSEDWAMLDYEGMRLRAVFVSTANRQKWVALRRVKELPPALTALGFPSALVSHLQDLGKRDGLILICGATGQGKTTTCCSMIIDFMQRYGGVAFTIEDPVEYDLAGRHGDSGYCFQVEVREDDEWAEMLHRSLRCHPRYIFIGEVCTPDVANQLLRASTSGHTVIATVHAGSMQEGLEGLLQLAEQKIGERAEQLLASSLSAVIHQSLGQFGMSMRFLIAGQSGQSAAVRGLIRDNKIGQLNTIADQQHAQLLQNGRISL